ncbi:hypothetical protein PVAP13_9NG404214 [Panicum virgatum]|uniref:Uncharacterized protein n=1 Tax=Panicum virgatum TaxID=38727 RepID=A0A8T0MQM3_PANVG|nr:hypothetical protein PVAP13_9NG404214 [Panicum virgatum]
MQWLQISSNDHPFLSAQKQGIFVALALRFDVSRGIKNRYFNSAFLRYTGFDSDHHCNELVSCCTGEFCCSGLLPFHPLISVISEILIWSFWGHMQPALLYIVPGVISFVVVHYLWNGEVKQVRF